MGKLVITVKSGLRISCFLGIIPRGIRVQTYAKMIKRQNCNIYVILVGRKSSCSTGCKRIEWFRSHNT